MPWSARNAVTSSASAIARPSSGMLISAMLSPADGLEEELENLDVPLRFVQVPPPSVQPVPPQEKGVSARMGAQPGFHGLREVVHILIVVDDGNPLAVGVGLNAVQTLQHLEAVNGETALPRVPLRQDGAPHRMGMEHGARTPCARDQKVQERFGGWFRSTLPGRFADELPLRPDDHDIFGADGPL